MRYFLQYALFFIQNFPIFFPDFFLINFPDQLATTDFEFPVLEGRSSTGDTKKGERARAQPILVSPGAHTLSVVAPVVVSHGVNIWVALRVASR